MREYEHFIVNGEIALPDHKSLKATYGSNFPEALEPNDPRFLEEVKVDMGNRGLVPAFLLSKVSPNWLENRGQMVGGGIVAAEVQQCDGGYTEMGVHKERIQK